VSEIRKLVLCFGPGKFRIVAMRHSSPLAALSLLIALALRLGPLLVHARAQAASQNDSRPPDWKGQWIRVGPVSFDPNKPRGLGQETPLTPEFQTILDASLAAQVAGGTGNDPVARCTAPGMPRMMINYGLGMDGRFRYPARMRRNSPKSMRLLRCWGQLDPSTQRIYPDTRRPHKANLAGGRKRQTQ
jgi:hypothetical protein